MITDVALFPLVDATTVVLPLAEGLLLIGISTTNTGCPFSFFNVAFMVQKFYKVNK